MSLVRLCRRHHINSTNSLSANINASSYISIQGRWTTATLTAVGDWFKESRYMMEHMVTSSTIYTDPVVALDGDDKNDPILVQAASATASGSRQQCRCKYFLDIVSICSSTFSGIVCSWMDIA